MGSPRFDRVINLVRYHRPSQFAWRALDVASRLRRKLVPARYSPTNKTVRLNSGFRDLLAKLHGRRLSLWPSRSCDSFLDDTAAGRFTFLNRCRDLNMPEGGINWDPPEPRLWRFHLQCQECLLELAANRGPDAAWDIVSSWLAEPRHATPFGDPDAWHPFCISRRLPVWLMLAAKYPPADSVAVEFWRAISNQVEWLRTHMEVDLGGNHLLENLRALAIAVTVLEGDVRVDSKELVEQILSELDEQVLPSGEHFERAPTYHALMLLAVTEILESLSAVAGDQTASVRKLALAQASMSRHLRSILHPDGQIPLFGDSVLGETPDPTFICLAEGDCKTASTEESDYWIDDGDQGDRLIVDFGPICCDHLPAHGHADLFTLEASVGGRRVIVDSGTYDYEDSEMRGYCRSTAAHNTASIDGNDQCDVWSRFRMGRRGHPADVTRGQDSGSTVSWASSWHDAYRHLGVPAVHRIAVARRDNLRDERFDWIIIDVAETATRCLASYVHFHPDFGVQGCSTLQDSFEIHATDSEDPQCRLECLACEESKIDDGWYCQDFGVRQRNQVVVLSGKDVPTSRGTWKLSGWRLTTPENKLAANISVASGSLAISWSSANGQADSCLISLESLNSTRRLG